MDEKRLAEIKQRAEATTPGPWSIEWQWERLDAYTLEAWAETPRKSGETFDDIMPQVDADRFFIEHAREDIPYLIGEIEQLRAARDNERDAANDLLANIYKWAYKTAGQSMPTAISDAIFEFECRRAHYISNAESALKDGE